MHNAVTVSGYVHRLTGDHNRNKAARSATVLVDVHARAGLHSNTTVTIPEGQTVPFPLSVFAQ